MKRPPYPLMSSSVSSFLPLTVFCAVASYSALSAEEVFELSPFEVRAGTDQYEIEAQWSSFGGFRTVIDADLKVSESLNLRAAAVYLDFDDWREVGGDKRKGIFLTARYQPNRNTTLRAEVEWGKLERVITYQALDQLANWNGITTNAGFLGPRDPVPPSLARWNQPRLVFNSARPDLGIVNWEGFAATGGVFGRGLKTEPQEGLPDFAVIPSYKSRVHAVPLPVASARPLCRLRPGGLRPGRGPKGTA